MAEYLSFGYKDWVDRSQSGCQIKDKAMQYQFMKGSHSRLCLRQSLGAAPTGRVVSVITQEPLEFTLLGSSMVVDRPAVVLALFVFLGTFLQAF